MPCQIFNCGRTRAKEKVLRVIIQKKVDRAEDKDDNGDPMMSILKSLVKKVFRIKTSKQC